MMHSSTKKMWLSIAVASLMVTVATAANDYLPPNKGYNYDRPSIPFPNTGNKPTGTIQAPVTARPVAPKRPYLPPVTTPPISNVPDNHIHDEHHDHEHDHHHHEPGMPFDFSYAVNEDGNDFSHNAKSDGDVTHGEYRIALPDGRTQIVKYTADWKNGFNAEVTYEGEARYPDQPTGYGRGAGNAIDQTIDQNIRTPGQGYLPANQGYQY